jgi:cobalt-zinc-cadmium efflux system outer membrane protein
MPTFSLRRARECATPTIFALACLLAFFCTNGASAQTLNLQEAFRRAAGADPAFPAADARIDAASAEIRQADTRPNPSVGLELENFAGTGPIGLFDEAQTTLSYSQTVERGNKREARTSVARAGLQTVEIEKQIYALDLFERVEIAWVEAIAADAGVALSADRLAAADGLLAETERRVEAAREPAFAGARVSALVAESEIALVHAQTAARTTKATLSAYWDSGEGFDLDTAWFEAIVANPGLTLNEENIDLALLSAQRERAGAQIVLEEARAITDPTFSGGIRHFALGNDVALVANVAIPLPLHNDNSGNIARAMAERRAADHDYAALRRNVQRELTTLQARVAAHVEEAEALAESAIPQSERALSLIHEGFDRGAFEYIDIIDAERALNGVRTRRLEILREYHLDMARLNRITGRHLSVAGEWETR